MLLLVDAGNTRVKWALCNHPAAGASLPVRSLGHWQTAGVVARADLGTLVEVWHGVTIERVLISNVAGADMRDALERLLSRVLGLRPVAVQWFASSAGLGGVRNGYREPTQLGCDRFASAIGAHALHPDQSLIIATCGTATTIDALTADGLFIGGMILPGLGLMAASLASNTAQLPQVAGHIEIRTPFADNTTDAIVSGCIAAQAGAIERAMAAHARTQAAVDSRPIECIISGGAASMIAPHLSVPFRRVDNLVLIGLHAAAMEQGTSC
ncbi:MAG: type III pantothenate kinase [Pseudomonadota bacterium]